MKIALVKKRYSLRHGGSERYCVNLSRRLQQSGHDVTIIGETIDDELKDDIDFIPIATSNWSSWSRNQSFAEGCQSAVKQNRFDIVYGIGRSYGLDAVRVTERLQSHWLNVHYRNPVRRSLEQMNPRHRTLINLERDIYQSKSVFCVVTQSQLDRQLVQKYYNIPEEKIRTIYNGVDTNQFHPGVREQASDVYSELNLDPENPLLVFASMDFEGKGLRYLLEGLSRIDNKEAHLLVLGSGPTSKFQKIANAHNVGKRVTFAGRRNDIQRYYGAGDLFLLPTAYEPFPNVNLEAMACGLPVMTTKTSGGADIIREGQNGYLIPDVQSVDEIVECLNQHLSLSTQQTAAMQACCWETAQQLTIDKNTQQTLQMFEEVLLEKFRV